MSLVVTWSGTYLLQMDKLCPSLRNHKILGVPQAILWRQLCWKLILFYYLPVSHRPMSFNHLARQVVPDVRSFQRSWFTSLATRLSNE